MDTIQIAYFLDVAETEHMTRSAKRLHVAQPALSRSIARLEAEVGASLFSREGRGLKLTHEGEILRNRLAKASAEISRGMEEIRDAQAGAQRTVRVQAQAASLVVINSIAGWMAESPDRRIELAQAKSAQVDVVTRSKPHPGAIKQSGFSEKIMLAAPASSGLGPTVTAAEASQMRLISLGSTFGFRTACDAACLANGITPQIAFESDNPEAVRKAIALGLGVGFWPEFSWGQPGAGIQLLDVDAPSFERLVYVSLLKDGQAAQEFYQHLATDVSRVMRNDAPKSQHGPRTAPSLGA